MLDPLYLVRGAGTTFGFVNGNCVRPTAGANGTWLPLTVPLGARLIDVTVGIYDAGVATTYIVQLRRSASTSTGHSVVTLDAIQGGVQSATVVEHVLAPSSSEIITDNSTYQLQFIFGSITTNALCRVSVTFDMTP